VRLRNENLVPPLLTTSKDFLLRRSHRQFASYSGGVLLTPHIYTREIMAVALRQWHTNRDVSLGSATGDLTPQRNAVHSVSMRMYSSLILHRANTSPSYNPQPGLVSHHPPHPHSREKVTTPVKLIHTHARFQSRLLVNDARYPHVQPTRRREAGIRSYWRRMRPVSLFSFFYFPC
jgi:hypothetical protein